RHTRIHPDLVLKVRRLHSVLSRCPHVVGEERVVLDTNDTDGHFKTTEVVRYDGCRVRECSCLDQGSLSHGTLLLSGRLPDGCRRIAAQEEDAPAPDAVPHSVDAVSMSHRVGVLTLAA